MENLKHVSPEYQQQLDELARTLVSTIVAPKPPNRWDSLGDYTTDL